MTVIRAIPPPVPAAHPVVRECAGAIATTAPAPGTASGRASPEAAGACGGGMICHFLTE